MYVIEMSSEPAVAGDRNTVGGWPILEAGQAWPDCSCGRRMALFFQIDVPDDVPVFGGEHLLVFQCPVHNDAVFGPARLPQRYWESTFWRIVRHGGGEVAASVNSATVSANPATASANSATASANSATASANSGTANPATVNSGTANPATASPNPAPNSASADETLQPRRLVLRAAGPDDEWAFRVGGSPAWIQGAEHFTCACGTELEFLAQVPENYGFPKQPGAPEQDGAFSSTAYGLFLGNMNYLLACPKRCDPAAAWPVNQN